MNCPKCRSGESQVLDSREGDECIRRRRECLDCHHRFTTYERVEPPLILVTKKNKDRERFDPDKIRRGVRTACKNRPITTAQIDMLVDGVAQDIYDLSQDEITIEQIGHAVQRALHNLDHIAYLRFTSVYQSFADIAQFEQAIHNIH